MDSNQNWKSLLSSGIMSDFLSAELKKEASKEDSIEDVLNQYDQFENDIKKDPIKLARLKNIKENLKKAEYRDKLDPKFVEALMMLDLGDE